MNKVVVGSHLLKKLLHKQESRGMEVMEFLSRCVRQGEIHELVTTDHRNLQPGDRVDRVSFLGFAEIANAGVIEAGDEVVIDNQVVGVVRGFDDCHFPNHYNILIEATQRLTAMDLNLKIGQAIYFREQAQP